MALALNILLWLLVCYAVLRIAGWRLDATNRKLRRHLKEQRTLPRNIVPGEYWFTVSINREMRLARLIVPAGYRRGGRLVVAADGVTLLRREGNMEVGNGLADWARERGFALAILYPAKSRYAGLLSGWNFPQGMVLHLPWRSNDLAYAQTTIETLREALKPSDVVAVGFSAGVDLFEALLENGAVKIDVLLSLCGTRLRRLFPAKGTKLVAFHGDNDPRLPWEGGVGRNLLTWVLILLGNWRILRSSPRGLVEAYCDANWFDFERPSSREERNCHTVQVWLGVNRPQVVLVKMHGQYGGHSFPGLKSVHSLLAKKHGVAAPREIVDPIAILYEFFPPASVLS
jgi:poly(3-hydroxybutyrate) depolymerase